MPTDTQDRYFEKFSVERIDGKPERPNAKYFTLDFANDPHARVALAAYAESVSGALPGLANDLRERLYGAGN